MTCKLYYKVVKVFICELFQYFLKHQFLWRIHLPHYP